MTGRRSRVAKVLGHRVDLDHVERTLRADGCDVRCVDGGPGLVLCAAAAPGDPHVLAGRAAERAGLPDAVHPGRRAVRARARGVPLLPTGKVDYATLTSLVAETPEEPPAVLGGTITERYATILGRADVRPTDTFTSLGGDSLSYVEASLHVEECLGDLPRGWHVMPVGQLEARPRPPQRPRLPRAAPRPTRGRSTSDRGARPPPAVLRLRTVETSVVLRAVAIVLIVGTHSHVFTLQGTAHALLVLVGYNLARFRLGDAPRRERVRGLLVSTSRVVAPALVLLVTVHLLTGQYARATVGLSNWAFGAAALGPNWRFWFVEAVVVGLVATTLLLATPWGDRLQRRHPFALPLVLSLLGMLWWQDLLFPPVPHMQGSALVVLWMFCLGWAAAAAGGVRERLVVTAVAVPSVGTFSGNPNRDLLTLAFVLLVIWVPTLRVPRVLVPLGMVLATSSLFIYVVHWQVLQELRSTPWLAFAAGITAGVAAWWSWTRAGQLLARLRPALDPSHPCTSRGAVVPLGRRCVRVIAELLRRHRDGADVPPSEASSQEVQAGCRPEVRPSMAALREPGGVALVPSLAGVVVLAPDRQRGDHAEVDHAPDGHVHSALLSPSLPRRNDPIAAHRRHVPTPE